MFRRPLSLRSRSPTLPSSVPPPPPLSALPQPQYSNLPIRPPALSPATVAANARLANDWASIPKRRSSLSASSVPLPSTTPAAPRPTSSSSTSSDTFMHSSNNSTPSSPTSLSPASLVSHLHPTRHNYLPPSPSLASLSLPSSPSSVYPSAFSQSYSSASSTKSFSGSGSRSSMSSNKALAMPELALPALPTFSFENIEFSDDVLQTPPYHPHSEPEQMQEQSLPASPQPSFKSFESVSDSPLVPASNTVRTVVLPTVVDTRPAASPPLAKVGRRRPAAGRKRAVGAGKAKKDEKKKDLEQKAQEAGEAAEPEKAGEDLLVSWGLESWLVTD